MALRQDATAVDAVATLGFQAELRRQGREADRMFGYAQKLSRRHLQTQLVAIEKAVAHGDIAAALNQYDIALRTSRAAPAVLFPVLTGALGEAPIRAELILTLAKNPVWASAFIAYLGTAEAEPHALAAFLNGLRRRRLNVPAEADAAAINRLLVAKDADGAWRYYASIRGDVDRRRSRDPRFTAELSTPSLFDWTVTNDASLSASIQRNGSTGLLDFAVPSSGSGMLLRQAQMLPPGAYIVTGHSAGIDQLPPSRPYWILTCALNGREIGRFMLSNSAEYDGVFRGRFDIPASCPVQTLALMARSSDALAGVTGQIDQVQLAPLETRR